jgi:hypothetical protein
MLIAPRYTEGEFPTLEVLLHDFIILHFSRFQIENVFGFGLDPES